MLTPAERSLGDAVDARSGKGFAPHGIGTVYDDLRVLDATWAQLESRTHITIPAQNRELVERSLHPDILAEIVANGGSKWERHDQYVEGDALAAALIAHRANVSAAFPNPLVAACVVGDARLAHKAMLRPQSASMQTALSPLVRACLVGTATQVAALDLSAKLFNPFGDKLMIEFVIAIHVSSRS